MSNYTKVAPATTVEQLDKINALQTQVHALLVTLMNSAESEHLTTDIMVNALWLAIDLMGEIATAAETAQAGDKIDALQTQVHALLVILMHSAESEFLTNTIAVNALWLATDRMEKLAAAIADALARLDEDEKGLSSNETLGGRQEIKSADLQSDKAKIYVEKIDLTNALEVQDTECTTNTFSGHPHPSAMRIFYACMKGIRQFNGGSRAPNKIPSGNKRRRLNAVVEARHLTKVATNETKRSGVSHD